MRFLVLIAMLANLAAVANAECANACNGHGKCTSYDMCICNRNWQANDCSERICQFGLAHVDSPKGDLDMSGDLSGPNEPIIDNSFTYPYGTTEQFPQMEDSDLNVLDDSAHYYMECSNKGTCDRATGDCSCFSGYDGVSCQRASCPGYPNSCSGHGVCKTINQLAQADSGNVYKLWDKDTTMGCECDQGFFGPDCSERKCKKGVDPLYLDDSATIKYAIFDFATLVTKTNPNTESSLLFSDGQFQDRQGYWAIRFYDSFGEDWMTVPIVAGASCAVVIAALENLPNNVVPAGKTFCTRYDKTAGAAQNAWSTGYDAQHPASSSNLHNHPYKIAYNLAIWEARTQLLMGSDSPDLDGNSKSSYDGDSTMLYGYIYRIKFYGNPGQMQQPSIEIHLDGKRPSLVAASTNTAGAVNGKVITKVWTDGQQGEDSDYFADHCDGVSVTIGSTTKTADATSGSYKDNTNPGGLKSQHFLTGITVQERQLLKTCLGDSDFDTSNNQDVYNWDKGTQLYPHIIKLVRTVTTYIDGGYYAAVWYDTSVTGLDNLQSEGTFKLLNPFMPPDAFATDTYEIYTTKGTFALTSNHSQALFSFASNHVFMTNATYDTRISAPYDGDISCELGNNNAYKMKYIFHCVNKTDIVTFLNFDFPYENPPNINLYTVQRLMHTTLLWDPYYIFGSGTGNNEGHNSFGAHYMTHMLTTDLSTNWGVTAASKLQVGPMYHTYKFFPATESTYNYVAPCSNRGTCDETTGLCKCFPGYTNDACDIQSSIAL